MSGGATPATGDSHSGSRAGKQPQVGRQALRAELQASFLEFEAGFRRNYPVQWWSTLVGPWVLTVVILLVIYAAAGVKYTLSLLGFALAAFVFFGRFVILGGVQGSFRDVGEIMTSEQICLMVTYMDVMVALVLAFHVGFLFRVPYIGPKILELVADGELILSLQPWMKRLTFWGLVAFIAFPLAATGSVGGAIFGRLLGLSRWNTFWGSVIGAVIGNGLMLAFSEAVIKSGIRDHWITNYGGLVLIVLIIVGLERRYAALKKQFLEEAEAAESQRG